MAVRGLAFSIDSSLLITGSDDKHINIYDMYVFVRITHSLTRSLTHVQTAPNAVEVQAALLRCPAMHRGFYQWPRAPTAEPLLLGTLCRALSLLQSLTLLADTAQVTGRSRCGTWRREVASTRSTTIRIKCGAWRTAPPAASSRRSRTTSSSWSTTASSVVVVVTNKSTQSTNQGSRQLRRLFTLRRTHAHARTNARIPSRSIDR